jgi:hypothetical protein
LLLSCPKKPSLELCTTEITSTKLFSYLFDHYL